jgi:cell division septum initiation protein DivIVA
MDNELKQCFRCKEYKALDLFHNHKSYKDGKQTYCKSCHTELSRAWYEANREKVKARNRAYREANPEKAAAKSRAWKKANPEKVAARSRAYQYGLTNERFQELLNKQNNSCRICRKSFAGKAAHIDHDHVCCPGKKSCGKCVRGLLCGNCNTALGRFKDNIEHLEQAVKYLRENANTGADARKSCATVCAEPGLGF